MASVTLKDTINFLNLILAERSKFHGAGIFSNLPFISETRNWDCILAPAP